MELITSVRVSQTAEVEHQTSIRVSGLVVDS